MLRFLRNTLRERKDVLVTTFFDLYGLPADFPGSQIGGRASKDPVDRAAAMEAGFHAAILQETGCRPDRFLPHIQPYEFEGLLFSDTSRFAEAVPAWRPFVGRLDRIRQTADSPEHINDGAVTHPSACLAKILRPRYRKVRHGAAVAARIGLRRIRGECRHFDSWMSRSSRPCARN